MGAEARVTVSVERHIRGLQASSGHLGPAGAWGGQERDPCGVVSLRQLLYTQFCKVLADVLFAAQLYDFDLLS